MKYILVIIIVIQFSISIAASKSDQTLSDFTNLVNKNENLFNFLPITKSGLKNIIILPHAQFPGVDPGYMLEEKTLLVGPLVKCDQEDELDFSPIHLHEYAHTVFTENFYLSFHLKGEAILEERYSPTKKTLADKTAELNKPVTPRDLIEPFDEVFADLFAALALDNPSALHQVLVACGVQDVARDFASNYNLEGWNQGTLKPTLLPYSSNYYSSVPNSGFGQNLFLDAKVHNVLSPFRSHIWKQYLALKGTPLIKNRMLKLTFQVAINVTRQLYDQKTTYGDWFQVSKEDLNRRAINELDDLINKELLK